jgi:hypothetical protein
LIYFDEVSKNHSFMNQKNPEFIKLIISKDKFTMLFYVVFSISSFIFIFFFICAPFRNILIFQPDDANYYYKIAENIKYGNGLTFDNINRTNGFQPLWLFILTTFKYIYNCSQEIFTRSVLISQVLILFLATQLLFKTLTLVYNSKNAFFSCIFFLGVGFHRNINGMESAIAILILSIIIYVLTKYFSIIFLNKGLQILLGFLFGLMFLSRLDFLFLQIPLLLWIFYLSIAKKNISSFFTIVSSYIITVSPYLALNYFLFDKLTPINGELKISFPLIEFAQCTETMSNFDTFILPGILLFLLAVLYVKLERKFTLTYFDFFTIYLGIGYFLHYMFHILFVRWGVYSWHFASYSFFAPLVIANILCVIPDRLLNIRNTILVWFICLIFLCQRCYAVFGIMNYDSRNEFRFLLLDAGLWAKENSAKSDIFALKDAGYFSFYSERNVVNLDGVVNDRNLHTYIKKKNLRKYLDSLSVKFLISEIQCPSYDIMNKTYTNYACVFFSHLYLVPSEIINVNRNSEVYRSKAISRKGSIAILIIWKLDNYLGEDYLD